MLGGSIAFGIHHNRAAECDEYMREFATLPNQTLSYNDALKRFDKLTSDADDGRDVCCLVARLLEHARDVARAEMRPRLEHELSRALHTRARSSSTRDFCF